MQWVWGPAFKYHRAGDTDVAVAMVVVIGGHTSSRVNKSETQPVPRDHPRYLSQALPAKKCTTEGLQMVIFLIFTWISKCSPMGTTTANLISAMQMLPVLLVLSVLAVLVSDLWSAMLAAKCPRL